MDTNFVKNLTISFGVHILVFVIFFINKKDLKKSETSMLEVIILSSNNNDVIEQEKDINKSLTKTLEINSKKTMQNKLVTLVKKQYNKNEFHQISKTNSPPNSLRKKEPNDSLLENKILDKPNNKDHINEDLKKVSYYQNNTNIFQSSATYKIGSVKNPHPTYPLIARKKGWEGKVIIQADIDKEGNVSKIKILESSGFKVLDNVSLKTLKKWKFTPARIGNEFVNDSLRIPVKFQLTN